MSLPQPFHLVLIKPSHYDDQGYVIQWERSAIPSNSLAALHAIAMDSVEREVLGVDVDMTIDAYDETNTVIPITRIIRKFKRGARGLVGLVGVQTNQFPRAVDLGKIFLDAQIPVIIGGFHVSGCLAMLPKIPGDIQDAMDRGMTMFAGEAEYHFDEVLRDTHQGTLKPLYNFLSDNPSLQEAPAPILPLNIVRKTFRRLASFDAGRGCPFQCSFCTIINVQGRTSRWRSADDIEALVRANLQQGIRRFFITDDDFARNKGWEEILDRLIQLREGEGLPLSLAIQVDTVCHKIPRFIEKAVRAGCFNIFMGLESLNPQSLADAKKRQNKIWEYREMLQAWKNHGCTIVAGYIIGFPQDTPESIAHDIDIIKKELPIDLLEFFCLTPLPGSEDHKNLYLRHVSMDDDMNKYDLEHVTTDHPHMSRQEWQEVYQRAWQQYYTFEHCETVMRRAAAKGQSVVKVMFFLLCFYGSITYEGIHPLEGGMFRKKARKMRRPGVPLESPFLFHVHRIQDELSKSYRWIRLGWRLNLLRRRIESDPNKTRYTDLAISPVTEHSEENLELVNTYAQYIPISHISRGKKGGLAPAR
ncbi:B12-binding domain-containing radical SAM protein [Candidatus Nitrospira salsa]